MSKRRFEWDLMPGVLFFLGMTVGHWPNSPEDWIGVLVFCCLVGFSFPKVEDGK